MSKKTYYIQSWQVYDRTKATSHLGFASIDFLFTSKKKAIAKFEEIKEDIRNGKWFMNVEKREIKNFPVTETFWGNKLSYSLSKLMLTFHMVINLLKK